VNNAGVGGNAAIRNVTDDYWDKVLGRRSRQRPLLQPPCPRADARGAPRLDRQHRLPGLARLVGPGDLCRRQGGRRRDDPRPRRGDGIARNVRVNAIAPGLIDTPMLRNRSEEALARLLKSVPMGRPGTPDDIANAVDFLASDRARVITGQVLYVCGGKSVYAYPDWSD
jgi:NAD(P)-dependent dehydrogenase (short-subunit alcohol dehydrogenase family)